MYSFVRFWIFITREPFLVSYVTLLGKKLLFMAAQQKRNPRRVPFSLISYSYSHFNILKTLLSRFIIFIFLDCNGLISINCHFMEDAIRVYGKFIAAIFLICFDSGAVDFSERELLPLFYRECRCNLFDFVVIIRRHRHLRFRFPLRFHRHRLYRIQYRPLASVHTDRRLD